LPPIGWYDGYNGFPSNIFKNREDAEKYAKERGWVTDFHTFRRHDSYMDAVMGQDWWDEE